VHWETTHLLAKAIEQAQSIDREKVRAALSAIHYASAVGEVTFDDHNQARLPMILLEIENGKPVIKGAYSAEIDYPK
jgi:branched-chain amino acid transport system substrate-binding protein